MNVRETSTLIARCREYRGFVLFLVLMVVFRSAFADWNTVPTGSMKPTIVEGDRIFVNKLAYDLKIPLTSISVHRFADPKRGDVVVFDSKAADTRLVKRVIGLPGDMVELRENHLLINGIEARHFGFAKLDPDRSVGIETYADMTHRIEVMRRGMGRLSSFGPVRVPDGRYLVLGDNRDNSADSRVYGFVPRQEIVGHATRVVLSLDYDRYFIPRLERSLQPL